MLRVAADETMVAAGAAHSSVNDRLWAAHARAVYAYARAYTTRHQSIRHAAGCPQLVWTLLHGYREASSRRAIGTWTGAPQRMWRTTGCRCPHALSCCCAAALDGLRSGEGSTVPSASCLPNRAIAYYLPTKWYALPRQHLIPAHARLSSAGRQNLWTPAPRGVGPASGRRSRAVWRRRRWRRCPPARSA